jgi:hypothetical protein
MKTPELMKLLKQAEPLRGENVLLDGDLVPKSVSMLVSLLKTETDPDNRYDLYRHMVLECQLTNKSAAAVKFAQARYQEFNDVTSLTAYSNALAENGKLEAGLVHAKEALDLAIRNQTLVNYAAGSLVRLSIKTGSVETVNEAIKTLVRSTHMPSKGDCALEVDWTDEALAMGADVQSINWVRSLAKHK